MPGSRGYHIGRRELLYALGASMVGCSRSCGSAPEPRWGVQLGDVTANGAVVWSRTDRASKMIVEWSTSRSFAGVRRVEGGLVTQDTDLCGKIGLVDLPAGTRIHYRARFEGERPSDWIPGAFTTAPVDARDVMFIWSGDTNGQGWGIDPMRGGMPAYKAVLDRKPDFFVHCGDRIYADDPIHEAIQLDDGTIWKNIVTEAKSHVAETLDDYRGAFVYARQSQEVRALSAAVPLLAIWDDHEVRDNWFPGETHLDTRYKERRIDALEPPARRAMLEHTPTLLTWSYRVVSWGPLLDLFLTDGRSFRTPNWPRPAEHEAYFGKEQIAWLVKALSESKATWKVIVCGQPVGLFLEDRTPQGTYEPEAIGKENGPPAGRELELAELLAAIKARGIKNVIWITADVHYAAAHHYDPSKAIWKDMDPFWEYVAGPMHASSFGRKRPDDTFGIDVAYVSSDWQFLGNPAAAQQYFGVVRIDGKSRALTVTLVDGHGRDVYAQTLTPS